MRPTVSDHAIDRYCERVGALPRPDAEQAIARAVQRGVDYGASAVLLNGVRYVLSGPHVVTVTVGPARFRRRMSAACRRRIAYDERLEA